MVGYNKSDQARRLRQTVELKVSPITTFVGVINPFLPPISPYSSRSCWCHQLARAYVQHLLLSVCLSCRSVCFSVPWPPCLLSSPPTLTSPSPSLLSAAVHVNMLRPPDMFVRGFGDEHYCVVSEEHLAGVKGYSIRIPPELCAEFLPSDKSTQQVTGRGRGGMRERGGRLTQSCLRGMGLRRMAVYLLVFMALLLFCLILFGSVGVHFCLTPDTCNFIYDCHRLKKKPLCPTLMSLSTGSFLDHIPIK